MTRLLVVLAVVIAVVAVVFVAVTLYVRSHPFETFVKFTRRSLVRSGMERQEIAAGDSSKVVYFRGGSGARTIVLVHGVNDQAGSWSTVIPKLAPKFRLVAIDLPGHGDSEPATGPLPMRILVDALAGVIDRESPNAPVILIGNSMGGWVSMLYAAEHPERVSHLVLEDASGMTWDISHVPAFPKNRDEARRLLRMVQGPKADIPDYLADAMVRIAPTLPQGRVLQTNLAEWLVDSKLARLTMPVTLIWGANDGLLPLDYANLLKSRIPGSTLHIIEHGAHAPHRQMPAEFSRIVLGAVG